MVLKHVALSLTANFVTASILIGSFVIAPGACGQEKQDDSFNKKSPDASLRPSAKVDDYFYFAGAEDKQKENTIGPEEEIQPWSEADKAVVRRATAAVFAEVPWLIAGSGWKHKIAFLRISRAKSSYVLRGNGPFAASGAGFVVFTDRFFGADNQKHILMHELVHVADAGNAISYSQDWIELALPIITKLRLREQLLSQNGWLWYDDEVRKQKIWTGLYGAKNLKEALAEYFTEVEENKAFIAPTKFADIARALKCPTEEQLAWRDNFTQGAIQYHFHHYQNAISFFRSAQVLDPLPLGLDFNMAQCTLDSGGKLEAELGILSKALDKCDALKLSADEPMMHSILFQKGSGLLRLDKRDEAIAIANKILACNLFDEPARFLRGYAQRADGSLGQALEDAYFSNGRFGFVFVSLTNISADPYIAQMALDEIVKTDKTGDGLWGRAQYYEQLAHMAGTEAEKTKYNVLALADYQGSIAKTDEHKFDGLVRCADLEIKLGRLSEAQSCCDDLMKFNSDSPMPKIVQFKISEALKPGHRQMEFNKIYRSLPFEKVKAELHDYNYLEPPSATLDSDAWRKAF